MKQLLTSLLLGLSVMASAQNDGIQYPFPYNPDGNSDGYISLPDMLDLLAVYGQEYPQSFYSDTTVAVLNLGRMGGHNCMQQAKNAGSDWRIPRISELARFSLQQSMQYPRAKLFPRGFCRKTMFWQIIGAFTQRHTTLTTTTSQGPTAQNSMMFATG